MPLTDWELWACAQAIINQKGELAPVHAAERIAALHGPRHYAASASIKIKGPFGCNF